MSEGKHGLQKPNSSRMRMGARSHRHIRLLAACTGEVSDPNATGAVRILGATSPAASNLSGDAAQSDHPHVLAGPAANPEPLPEGLSPPLHHSASEDGGGPAAELRSAAHILPAELREAPPGDPHPDLVAKVRQQINQQAACSSLQETDIMRNGSSMHLLHQHPT
jgi:hypothetical protein